MKQLFEKISEKFLIFNLSTQTLKIFWIKKTATWIYLEDGRIGIANFGSKQLYIYVHKKVLIWFARD